MTLYSSLLNCHTNTCLILALRGIHTVYKNLLHCHFRVRVDGPRKTARVQLNAFPLNCHIFQLSQPFSKYTFGVRVTVAVCSSFFYFCAACVWARIRIDYTGCAQRRASRDDAVECIVLGT
jgi:hypothetical protein